MMLMRVLRCLCVSVGTTLLSAVVLVALALGLGMSAGLANIIAVCCGIVPSYVANRRWVWKRPGRGSLTHEVLPFWVLSLTGLAVSTITVARVATLTSTWTSSARAVALPVANLSVFAALWVVQFVLLDRVIFRQRGMETCPAP
jgi:putative flippase GtrA